MPRTAPAPNIPAIPGMNPGVFVMGGGGGGGGGSGKGGKGAGGGQGANGENGGEDAQGGGDGANGCGQGSGAGCPNPAHGGGGGTAAGDPVDVASGRVFTHPQLDLAVGGPLPLLIHRAYSTSARDRDVGLGLGWTHSLAWEIVTRRRTMLVYRPDGTIARRPVPEVGDVVDLGGGAKLTRQGDGFTVVDTEGVVHLFGRATNTINRWLLRSITDLNGNAIQLSYRDDVLDHLYDSARRKVVVRWADGHIRAFTVVDGTGASHSFRRYEYEGDHLTAAIDGEGRAMRFAYEEGLLTQQIFPSGLTVHFRYTLDGRCRETWTEQPGEDPALSPDAPKLLADGATEARGMLHCRFEYGDGFTEVVDSRQVRRYEGNGFGKVDKAALGPSVQTLGYDALGNPIAYVDALGNTTTYQRAPDGRVVGIIDPSGAITTFEHNLRGNLVRVTDAAGSASDYVYDEFSRLTATFDQLGEVIRFEYDRRGKRSRAVLPDGAATTFRYDAAGNLVELVEPNGASRHLRFDALGRVTGFTDENGHDHAFSYNRCGQLTSVTLPNGAQQHIDYDLDGRPATITSADGRTQRLHWAGYGVVHRIDKADGTAIRFLYDRECDLVGVVNERDEVHRIERDGQGRILRETTFDGRVQRYDHDAMGRIDRTTFRSGRTAEVERDPCGRVTKRIYDDGTEESFLYDGLGRLLSASSEEVTCLFDYDERGRVVRESVHHGERSDEVRSRYAARGRTGLSTSLGHDQRWSLDPMALPERVTLDEEATIVFEWDNLDAEVKRQLPDGGLMVQRYGALGALEERVIQRPHPGSDGPQWVGRVTEAITYAAEYEYSPGGDLLREKHEERGASTVAYDAMGRLRGVLREDEDRPLLDYDAAGRPHVALGSRTYGAGGRLESDGDTRYRYDDDGRLIARETPEGTWRYEWNGRGLLSKVHRPDGSVVTQIYDPLARRILKRVQWRDGWADTRFVWDGERIVHEVQARDGVIQRERTYLFRERQTTPIAHRDVEVVDGERRPGPWLHYVVGPGEHPTALVDGRGEVVADWGLPSLGQPGEGQRPSSDASDAPPTPIRFPGQYHDEETGLVYNRHRFLDPGLGRYISPDPLGLVAGLDPYAYAYHQPFRFLDPLGLAPPVTTTVGGTAGSDSRESGGPPGPLHPVVEAAMPPRAPDDSGVYPSYRDGPPPGRSPTSCGEPRAMSDYIQRWEEQNRGGRPMDPDNPADMGDIQRCLGSITSVSSTQPRKNGSTGTRAPCPNCSQLFANLNDQWGQPDPSVIQPGATTREGTDSTNFSPPSQQWSNGQHQAMRQGGGRSGPQPPVVADPVPEPTGPAFPPHSGYGEVADEPWLGGHG